MQLPCIVLGLEDAGLASILESMEFCLKLRGSEACVLEDLAKAINLVHIRRDLVESGHSILNHAYHVQQEYERCGSTCSFSFIAGHYKTTVLHFFFLILLSLVQQ